MERKCLVTPIESTLPSILQYVCITQRISKGCWLILEQHYSRIVSAN